MTQIESNDKRVWHVEIGSKKLGPYSLAELTYFTAEGKVNRSTLVWREGMWEWLPCRSVPELRHLFPGIGEELATIGGMMAEEGRERIGSVRAFIRSLKPVHAALIASLLIIPLAIYLWPRPAPHTREKESIPAAVVESDGSVTVEDHKEIASAEPLSTPNPSIDPETVGTDPKTERTSATELPDASRPEPVAPDESASEGKALDDTKADQPAVASVVEISPMSEVVEPPDPPATVLPHETAPPKAVATPTLPTDEVQQVLDEARASRSRLLRIEFSGTKPNLDQYLYSGDQSIRLSEQYADQGRTEIALASAQQAKNFFEAIEAQFMRSPGATLRPADDSGKVEEAFTSSSKPTVPQIIALALPHSFYRPNDTVKATINFNNLSASTSYLRRDTVLRFDGGQTYNHTQPETFTMKLDPPGGTHITNFPITTSVPNGSYAIRTEIMDASQPTSVLLTHDFAFQVTDSSTSLLAADEKGENPLGKVGGALKRLGVDLRIERKD